MAQQIHPTAIIEPGAQLGEDVIIGAYAFVGGKAVIGDGTVLHHHANVEGRTTIGRQCEIFPFSCVGTKTHDLKYKGGEPGLVVGDRNVFREYVSVHGATNEADYTRMGDDNVMLAYSHIAHDCIVGHHLVMSAQSALAGHVVVEDHVNIGWGSGVHQFCRVGSHSMLGAMSKVVQDVPPYIIADGNAAIARSINKVGLERHEFTVEQLDAIKQAFRLFYRSGYNRTQAFEHMRQHKLASAPEFQHFLNFVTKSERGVVAGK
ncbi:Acyl-[acyl-carrier-protein]--UDP-N-acetylglucosamine O-acyltransferase [Lacunisphaera limnophila]|uniref:Acyl-[acyl-carrier-protein]--UDP-N-acetylglucosamine O-acyltransferase n=1 Tax=Lacunisphaera limnophila TaxID=1838286 RepID=A0A1D8AZX0_9BACT|nr:acyl-ACP--UDP-N-acetylglucosamine O-acyltransferase [Lacunisphaera limnophila]AOS46435.1 Acyl-[acyl-carrier-protein]--UDP-N-acetylglucosamine O-acyltransferase [Lacunisphaera limnophila]